MLQPCNLHPNTILLRKKSEQKHFFFIRSLRDYIFNDGKSETEESSCDLVTTTRGTHSHVVQLEKLFCDIKVENYVPWLIHEGLCENSKK